MKVRIQTQGFDLTPPIGARVHSRLSGLHERFGEEVTSVDVYLKDLNGPKGGLDKQALIRVQIRHLSPVSITTTRNDLYKAINVCARRTLRTVRRAVGRKRLVRRVGLQYVASATGNF